MVSTAIRVVSLASASTRRAAFAERARGADCNWSFFDALTALNPAQIYNEARARVVKRALLPGELGCFGSHYSLWSWLLQSEHQQLVVFEDDAIIDWTFVRMLCKLDLARLRMNYLRLYAIRTPKLRLKVGSIGGRHLFRMFGYAYGTQGYVITRRGAEQMLPHARMVTWPVDDLLDRSWSHGLANLCVFPFVVREAPVESTITQQARPPDDTDQSLAPRRFLYRAVDRTCRVAHILSEGTRIALNPPLLA